MEQGSHEWIVARLGKITARLGKITASRFNDIVKIDGTLRTGDTPNSYMNEKIVEIMNHQSKNIVTSTAIEWSTDNESDARKLYEELTFSSVREVGFFTHSEMHYVGCYPDGLINGNGGIKIDCPYNSEDHVNTISNKKVPSQYIAQIQGNIWINDLDWVDFVSYDPRMIDDAYKIYIIRCRRDYGYIDNLISSLGEFWKKLQEKIEQLEPYIQTTVSI